MHSIEKYEPEKVSWMTNYVHTLAIGYFPFVKHPIHLKKQQQSQYLKQIQTNYTFRTSHNDFCSSKTIIKKAPQQKVY
jgi:hypothetical protein